MNPTDLRRRLEQVSRPTSGNILEPLSEKLEDIAEKFDKGRIETKAMWERDLEEVKIIHHLLKMLFDAQMIRREGDHLIR